MTISELKKEAKVKLAGKWGKAILLTVIYTIIVGILEMIGTAINNNTLSAIYRLVIAIINVPFSYGFIASMIKLSRGEDVGITDFITLGLQSFGKVWAVVGRTIQKLILPIILIIISIVILIIGVVQNFAQSINYYSTAASTSSSYGFLSLVGIILFIAAWIYYIVKALSYQLTSYILYDNQNATGKEIVEKSADLMTGNKWKYIGIAFSFIGWYLLIVLITFVSAAVFSNSVISSLVTMIALLVIAFYLSPYIAFTTINFYEDLNGSTTTSKQVEENKEEQE